MRISDWSSDVCSSDLLSFVENALLKARHAALVTGLPALADDSGRCVDALGGAPGLYSARYAGGHGDAQANIDKLLDALREVPDERRGAHFHAAIVLLRHAEHPQPLIAEGSWHGPILHARRGAGGFGYDPNRESVGAGKRLSVRVTSVGEPTIKKK